MDFFEKYKNYIILSLLIITLFVLGIVVFSNNSTLHRTQKEAKYVIDSLHKDNQVLIKKLELTKDSIIIFHDLAVIHSNTDTVYLKQIKYLQSKTIILKRWNIFKYWWWNIRIGFTWNTIRWIWGGY